MIKEEKEVLRIAIERKQGLYSPAEMINGIAGHNRKLVEDLVVKGYLEEVSQQISTGAVYNFYRVSHKGLILFSSWYKKLWFSFRNDLRVIIVSIVASSITTIVAIMIEKSLKQ
ncbi:MAG: hypothetical protein Q7K40_03515 [bacterium]|nr:hypothetical protein [bacterium]